MAVTFQSRGTTSTASPATPGAPSGVTTGDLLTLFVASENNGSAAKPTSGLTPGGDGDWTLVAEQSMDNGTTYNWTGVWRKEANGTNDTPTLTISSGGGHIAFLVRCDGHDSTTPVADFGTATDADNTIDIPISTAIRDGSLYLVVATNNLVAAGSYGTPTGYTENLDTSNGSMHIWFGYKAYDAGDSDADSLTYSGSATRTACVGVMMQPPAAPPSGGMMAGSLGLMGVGL